MTEVGIVMDRNLVLSPGKTLPKPLGTKVRPSKRRHYQRRTRERRRALKELKKHLLFIDRVNGKTSPCFLVSFLFSFIIYLLLVWLFVERTARVGRDEDNYFVTNTILGENVYLSDGVVGHRIVDVGQTGTSELFFVFRFPLQASMHSPEDFCCTAEPMVRCYLNKSTNAKAKALFNRTRFKRGMKIKLSPRDSDDDSEDDGIRRLVDGKNGAFVLLFLIFFFFVLL